MVITLDHLNSPLPAKSEDKILMLYRVFRKAPDVPSGPFFPGSQMNKFLHRGMNTLKYLPVVPEKNRRTASSVFMAR